MRIVFLLHVYVLLLFAQKCYPYFSLEQQQNIKDKYGKFAYNRVVDYQKTIAALAKKPQQKRLVFLNRYINQFLSQYDSVSTKYDDYWSTPVEFLLTGRGDCEDYAFLKYYSLIQLGFAPKQLYFAIVKEKSEKKNLHMVLCYLQDKNAPLLVLDNLSFKVLSLNKRYDLKPLYFFNPQGYYKLKKNKLIEYHQKTDTQKIYSDFLKKVNTEMTKYSCKR